jgi:hypothetical protein
MTTKRFSIALLLLAAACDAGPDEPTKYEDMDFDQRVAFMGEVVLPEMRATFVAFDASYKDMTCATCHGEGASDGSYAMPSPQLPVLPATEEAFLEYIEDPEHARWSQFMIEEAEPRMAELLGVPVWDPVKAPMGLSCNNCHMVEGQL